MLPSGIWNIFRKFSRPNKIRLSFSPFIMVKFAETSLLPEYPLLPAWSHRKYITGLPYGEESDGPIGKMGTRAVSSIVFPVPAGAEIGARDQVDAFSNLWGLRSLFTTPHRRG